MALSDYNVAYIILAILAIIFIVAGFGGFGDDHRVLGMMGMVGVALVTTGVAYSEFFGDGKKASEMLVTNPSAGSTPTGSAAEFEKLTSELLQQQNR